MASKGNASGMPESPQLCASRLRRLSLKRRRAATEAPLSSSAWNRARVDLHTAAKGRNVGSECQNGSSSNDDVSEGGSPQVRGLAHV